MPNWGEHILIANKLLKRINVDKNLFLFGNILPDVQNGYLVKGISNLVSHSVDHFDMPKEHRNYENFSKIYGNKLDNPIILGYMCHLMADYYWNHMFYDKKCIRENNIAVGYVDLKGKLIKKPKKELREDKQREFEAFQYYIYENYEMQLPEYDSKIVKNSNLVETININDQDVKLVIDYIKNSKKMSKEKNQTLKIYTTKDLEQLIDDTVDFIYKYI